MNLIEAPTTEGTLEMESRAIAPSWPVVQNGSNSISVKALQYLLKARGYSLTADGDFGPGTQSAVIAFQRASGLSADGIVGSATWTKVIITVQQGSNGQAVMALQDLLKTKFGYSISVDGAFGAGTKTTVISFQNKYGLGADGIVGPTTWQYLIGTSTDFWGERRYTWTFP